MMHDTMQIELDRVSKRFGKGPSSTLALDGVSLMVQKGETLLLMGPSGSGKTTLLTIMGGLLTPDSGRVRIAGKATEGLGPSALARLRLAHLGFIFQEYHLFNTLTVLENLLVVQDLKGVRGRAARGRATELLEQVGLGDKLAQHPTRLSGGQKQRLAVARALSGDPALILADEPTAALDSENGRLILEMLHRLTTKFGRTLVIVTHDHRIRRYADRILQIEDGRLLDTPDHPTPAPDGAT